MCAAVGWGDVPQQAREACHSRQGEHATAGKGSMPQQVRETHHSKLWQYTLISRLRQHRTRKKAAVTHRREQLLPFSCVTSYPCLLQASGVRC